MNRAAQPKIYVAGHQGMVGSALVRNLLAQGLASDNLITRTRQELDLTNQRAVQEFFALEQVRLKEKELKDLMLIAGRPGLWDDWCRFQSQVARQEIDDAIKSAKVLKKKQDDKEELTLIMMTVFLMLLAVSVIVGLIYIISLR